MHGNLGLSDIGSERCAEDNRVQASAVAAAPQVSSTASGDHGVCIRETNSIAQTPLLCTSYTYVMLWLPEE